VNNINRPLKGFEIDWLVWVGCSSTSRRSSSGSGGISV